MRIEIAERLRPFSHQPGTFFVLPGSCLRLQVFPTTLKIDDLTSSLPTPLATLTFEVQGPVEDFTVVQDLERGQVRVWAKTSKGYFRYRVMAMQQVGISLVVEKTPLEGVDWNVRGDWTCLGEASAKPGTTLRLAPPNWATGSLDQIYQVAELERLSLGAHKLQDWELMRRRRNFCEIFPLWYRLGQMVPPCVEAEQGAAVLLKECQSAVAGSETPQHILTSFYRLYLAGFESGLSPRLVDSDYQGIIPEAEVQNLAGSPLSLLAAGWRLIRALFLQQETQCLRLLPKLPPEFHCGRLLHAYCPSLGHLSMEWSKKAVRRVIFQAERSQSLTLICFKGETSCRLRLSHKDRGNVYLLGTSLEVVAGQNYWFDNFQR